MAEPAIQFSIPGKPIPAPRQSGRDRWRPRDCVIRYRDYRDRIREAVAAHDLVIPDAKTVAAVLVTASFEMPESWSQKKRAAQLAQPMRSKPDIDNVMKAVVDTLWEKGDQAIPCMIGGKVWADRHATEVAIFTSPAAPAWQELLKTLI